MITENQIKEITRRIVESYMPDKIILFGSYAYGKPTKDSDIDLLIIKDDTTPKIERKRKLRESLSDLIIPVDIFIKSNDEYNELKDIIGTIIYPAAKYGRVIYESGR